MGGVREKKNGLSNLRTSRGGSKSETWFSSEGRPESIKVGRGGNESIFEIKTPGMTSLSWHKLTWEYGGEYAWGPGLGRDFLGRLEWIYFWGGTAPGGGSRPCGLFKDVRLTKVQTPTQCTNSCIFLAEV